MSDKITPWDKITIRCISLKGDPQKVKFMYPAIVNNKQLLKNVEFVISDPNYNAKMECVTMKKPYSENGLTNEPLKESFAAPVKLEPEKKIEQPKNEIDTPAIKNEPVKEKRTRRTKAQMLEAKTKTKQTA